MAENSVLDVHCATCGAAVQFNILKQVYTCNFCGSATPTTHAVEEKKGFQKLKKENMLNNPPAYKLQSGTCNSCGAKVIFPEKEAMTQCAFCGKSLVRKDYLKNNHAPELLIPFALEKSEAETLLSDWCKKNAGKKEARILKDHISEMNGVYLPYELARGPVKGTVKRNNTMRQLSIRGFVEGSFVNASQGLDNLLLNEVEPFDLSGIREMDFSYLAGSTVKVRDLPEKMVDARVADELNSDYEKHLVKTMETRAFRVTSNTENLMRMEVILPIYYLCVGEVIAAVNGQTGKVAVRERKDRFLLPWWIKPILATLLFVGATALITILAGGGESMALLLAGILGIYFLVVTFAMYSDYSSPRWRLRRRVFTTNGGPYIRQDGKLVQSPTPIPGGVDKPFFVEIINGAPKIVEIKYSAASRMIWMIFLSVIAILIPFIMVMASPGSALAGFGAVLLCITVPVTPIYFIKFGRLNIYEHPWIYYRNERGQRVRYKAKK